MIYKKDLLLELGYSRELQEFLKKHGVLLRFIIARNNRKNPGTSKRLLISSAFIWSSTEEGREYWKNLDILWQKQNN